MTIEATAPPPHAAGRTRAALSVEDLSLAYVVRGIRRPVLRGVSFEVRPGESYGLVGESGCGKSTTAYAAVRYLPRNAVITGGRILVAGEDVTKMNDEQVRQFRMRHASMVYQDPGAALNPTTKVGAQVVEAFTVLGQGQKEAEANALKALERVQIADPERVFQRYPHQLSGRDAAAGRHRHRAGLATPSSSSSTSRRPGSTLPSRRASSTSSARSRPRPTPPSCSSPTTSASSGRCATGSA